MKRWRFPQFPVLRKRLPWWHIIGLILLLFGTAQVQESKRGLNGALFDKGS